jgi:predicted transcriptional regulator
VPPEKNQKQMNDDLADADLIILENIFGSSQQNTPLHQRDLARIAGTSLGMTNSILKRLAKKGWITIKKMNSRNIRYAITLDGFNEIIRRSYRYFKRTLKNVFYYKDRIDEAIAEAKKKHYTTVKLIGSSDLEFILEHSCRQNGLLFSKTDGVSTERKKTGDKTLAVYSESISDYNGKARGLHLSKIILHTSIPIDILQGEAWKTKETV